MANVLPPDAGTQLPVRKLQRMAQSDSDEKTQRSPKTGGVVPVGGSRSCTGFSFAIPYCFPGECRWRESVSSPISFAVEHTLRQVGSACNARRITRGYALGDRAT